MRDDSAIEQLAAGETVIDEMRRQCSAAGFSPGQQIAYLAGDIDSVMVERTRPRAATRGLTQALTGFVDLESLAYEDSSADLFACFSGLHMLGDPSRAIREIAPRLKPGGPPTRATRSPGMQAGRIYATGSRSRGRSRRGEFPAARRVG